MKTRVAIAMGGFSPEFEISMLSGNVVYENLDRTRYEPYKALILKDRWVVEMDGKEYPIDKNDFSITLDNGKVLFDVVFMAIHGTPGEDGLLQAYFELIGLPHTTSPQFESALTFNKAECSALLKYFGVNTPNAYYLAKHETANPDEIVDALGLPLFVKPNRSGSSYGVSKVKSKSELPAAIEKAFQYDTQIVMESAVIGTEVGCGVTNFGGKIEAIAITEIVPANEFFDYESKYSGQSKEITPARIPAHLAKQITEESEFIYESLNLHGIARVDYIISQEGTPFLIEVNTVPGLSEESIVPKQAASRGISLGEFFHQAIQTTLAKK